MAVASAVPASISSDTPSSLGPFDAAAAAGGRALPATPPAGGGRCSTTSSGPAPMLLSRRQCSAPAGSKAWSALAASGTFSRSSRPQQPLAALRACVPPRSPGKKRRLMLVDTTGDGIGDTALVDTTGDGQLDTAFSAQTEAPAYPARGRWGRAVVMVDTTGDGVRDTVLVDTTGDGRVDAALPVPPPLPLSPMRLPRMWSAPPYASAVPTPQSEAPAGPGAAARRRTGSSGPPHPSPPAGVFSPPRWGPIAALDTTHDGHADTYLVDTTADGLFDTAIPASSFSAAGPWRRPVVCLDTTGDGRDDTALVDTTGDGRFDTTVAISGGGVLARARVWYAASVLPLLFWLHIALLTLTVVLAGAEQAYGFSAVLAWMQVAITGAVTADVVLRLVLGPAPKTSGEWAWTGIDVVLSGMCLVLCVYVVWGVQWRNVADDDTIEGLLSARYLWSLLRLVLLVGRVSATPSGRDALSLFYEYYVAPRIAWIHVACAAATVALMLTSPDPLSPAHGRVPPSPVTVAGDWVVTGVLAAEVVLRLVASTGHVYLGPSGLSPCSGGCSCGIDKPCLAVDLMLTTACVFLLMASDTDTQLLGIRFAAQGGRLLVIAARAVVQRTAGAAAGGMVLDVGADEAEGTAGLPPRPLEVEISEDDFAVLLSTPPGGPRRPTSPRPDWWRTPNHSGRDSALSPGADSPLLVDSSGVPMDSIGLRPPVEGYGTAMPNLLIASPRMSPPA